MNVCVVFFLSIETNWLFVCLLLFSFMGVGWVIYRGWWCVYIYRVFLCWLTITFLYVYFIYSLYIIKCHVIIHHRHNRHHSFDEKYFWCNVIKFISNAAIVTFPTSGMYRWHNNFFLDGISLPFSFSLFLTISTRHNS